MIHYESNIMYLMYVDESGDIGVENSKTRFFILSAMVVHELRWNDALEVLIDFRKHLRDTKKLKLRKEILTSDYLNKPGELVRIPLYDRIDILKQSIKKINSIEYLNVFSVRIDKSKEKYKNKAIVFRTAWQYLIQRFENTLEHNNFKGPSNSDDKGVIIADNTDAPKLRSIYRKMRRFNPTPHSYSFNDSGSRDIPIKLIVEDPIHRDSKETIFYKCAM